MYAIGSNSTKPSSGREQLKSCRVAESPILSSSCPKAPSLHNRTAINFSCMDRPRESAQVIPAPSSILSECPSHFHKVPMRTYQASNVT